MSLQTHAWAVAACIALLPFQARAQAAGATPENQDEQVDAGTEPTDGGTSSPVAPASGQAADSLRTLLMGADSVFMRSGLLSPAAGSGSLELAGTGEVACERFSARPDRRPIQVVADDRSSISNACYRLGHLALSGEVGLGKRLGTFFHFVPLMIASQSGGPVNRTAVGASDLTAGFRLQVFDDDVQGAMVVAVGIPIGRSTSTPPIGSGDFRADFLSYVSKLFEPLPVLLAMGMGMRLRGWAEVNEVSPTTTVIRYSNELRYEIRAGYVFRLDRPWLRAVVVNLTSDGRWSLDPGVEDGLGILNSPTGTELRVGLKVIAQFPYGLRATVSGGQLVIGHSVPIFTYFGASIGVAR